MNTIHTNPRLPDAATSTPRLESAPLALIRPYTRMRDCFRVLAVANLVLLPLAIAVYGERYRFLSLALSDLGLPFTPGGEPNFASVAVFVLVMATGSACMIWYALLTLRARNMPNRLAKTLFAFAAAGGFLVGIFPHEPFEILHMVGCATMVGSLWFLGNIFTVELGTLGRRKAAVAVQAVLQATVLPYAGAYFAGSDVKQGLQKLAIAGLFVSLTIATARLREGVLVRATRVTAWNNAVTAASAGGSSPPRQAQLARQLISG